MLRVLECGRVVRLATGGHLQPWLGPAVRGLVAGRWRAKACRFPVAEWVRRWPYCAGCPHNADCSYGRTVEPDPPPHAHVATGHDDIPRPLVLHAAFPLDEQVEPGYQFPLRAVFVGDSAADAPLFWDTLREAGADPNAGFGPDHILFDLLPDAPDRQDRVQLPTRLDPLDRVPRLRVNFTGPLLLRTRNAEGRRFTITRPTFADLLRASLRTIGPLARFFGDGPLPDDLFRTLKSASEPVPTLRAEFRPFSQVKSSSRGQQRLTVDGVFGWAEYGPLPRALADWLAWGGRLHVGTHRTAGAGGWTTTVS